MDTVNSLSGGKTSSYIAVHYPADYELFSLVCIDNWMAGGKMRGDKQLMQTVNDKLQKYCSDQKPFVATAEDPKIITTMLDLEQKIGREIIWLRGLGFEDMMDKKKAIPNQMKRFCTTEMKIVPIFEFLFKYTKFPVKMRIGFRYDELERADKFTDTFKYVHSCKNYKQKRNNWKEIIWREGHFPLIDDKIFHKHVIEYWDTQNIIFPEDSNCQNCFWKRDAQLRKNFDTNLPIMAWAGVQESMRGHTFKKDKTLFEIGKEDLEQDFIFGTGSGCQAGFCTD